MKKKPLPRRRQTLLKTGFFIAGMCLSAIITNVIDRCFPPDPVVVHTVIDSVKIVHEYRERDKMRKKISTTPKSSYASPDKQP
jgi:hypothetical protein